MCAKPQVQRFKLPPSSSRCITSCSLLFQRSAHSWFIIYLPALGQQLLFCLLSSLKPPAAVTSLHYCCCCLGCSETLCRKSVHPENMVDLIQRGSKKTKRLNFSFVSVWYDTRKSSLRGSLIFAWKKSWRFFRLNWTSAHIHSGPCGHWFYIKSQQQKIRNHTLTLSKKSHVKSVWEILLWYEL